MPLKIQNRGPRAAVIQLDASVLKVRQIVRTSRRHPKTGAKTIISKRRVIGGSLTILCGETADKLPNGQPIPATVGRLEQVRRNRHLRISEISEADWNEKHRSRPEAPRSRRKTKTATED